MLNHMAVVEKPFIGRVFLVIVGCTMMAVSLLVIGVKAQKYFFPKKKKHSRHIFLKDQLKKNKQEDSNQL